MNVSESNSINWGIVGVGAISKKFVKNFSLLKNCSITSICSRSIEKANAFANEFGLDYAYGSPMEMILSSGIDAVYIATPISTHFEIAKLFLRHGISVLVEKPIVVNVDQLDILYEIANNNKAYILDGMWTLYNRNIQKISDKNFIQKFGRLQHMESTLAFNNTIVANELFESKEYGGALADLGVYQIYIASLFSRLDIAHTACSFIKNSSSVDLTYNIVLLGDNISARLSGSIVAPEHSFFKVISDEYEILIPHPIFNPKIIIFLPKNRLSIKKNIFCFFLSLESVFNYLLQLAGDKLLSKKYNPLHYQVLDINDLISGKKLQPLISYNFTRRAIQTLEDAIKVRN
ncbi:Gfo/Idh/MocA family oxidoreductase [Polynucleobacter sp. VK25]|uniref:Gfo/Idh/MocA family protein n=1 Tax=Polynucleobacter sp. VK25 TaxID=1758398 RepID=UPI001BFDCB89|nr:Gfo/Idh/MocA family oxidoreductase [Polynucleobacter sp. VK25]QWD68649.1 Gfo/Idh/MocA family oxidoreductase [Polynucleobacter sp. VK25]